ncbi:MAG: GGDEF domain-containing protein [Pseudomonadota bacterium]
MSLSRLAYRYHLMPPPDQAKAFRRRMVATNVERLFWIGSLSVPVHLFHVLLFLGYEPQTAAEQDWRTGIMLFHSVMTLYMTLLALVSFRLTRHPSPHFTRARLATQWITLTVFLTAATVVVTIDQWVTPAITPFLVVCTVAGAFFLLPPLQALAVYGSAYLLFTWLLGLTQQDPAILLSNRVNGFTAVAIAMGLSLILWRNAVTRTELDHMIAEQRDALTASNRRLEALATRDTLTGLPNRRAFLDTVRKEIMQMKRNGQPSCLLLIDIDHFKEINDEHGHPTGDGLLKDFARFLKSHLREADTVARWGGEEFIVLLHNTDDTRAFDVAEGLRARIQQHRFWHGEGQLPLTISGGISQIDVSREDAFEAAYQRADQALYRAKSEGRNRCRVA